MTRAGQRIPRDPNFIEQSPQLPVGECWYFGCWGGEGHFLRTVKKRYISNQHIPDLPFHYAKLDGGFLDQSSREQREGFARFLHVGRFTVISFWDRTVDHRPGSNSAFVIRGEYSFDDAIEISKRAFPDIWRRFPFPIVEIK